MEQPECKPVLVWDASPAGVRLLCRSSDLQGLSDLKHSHFAAGFVPASSSCQLRAYKACELVVWRPTARLPCQGAGLQFLPASAPC